MSQQSTRSMAQIEAELAASRVRLAGTVDELVARVQPRRLVDDQLDSLKRTLRDQVIDEHGDLRGERVAAALGAMSLMLLGMGLIRRASARRNG